MRALYKIYATTPERSAENAVRLLTDDQAASIRGNALLSPRHFEPTPIHYDPEIAEETWAITNTLLAAKGLCLHRD